MKLNNITSIALFLFLATCGTAHAADINIQKHGGRPNGDITKAFTSAWKEACESTTPSRIVIPGGVYTMREIDLRGPCKAPLEIQVDGTIKAPADPNQLNGAYQWIKFGYVNFFTLSGKGVFDGQGARSWQENDCGTNNKCKRRSMNFGFNYLDNSIIRDVTSKDSKNFHVNVLGCKNITFDHFTISAPHESINTDGIHIGRSTGVKVVNSNIGTGDDCVSLGDGCRHVTVQNVNCGPGHGISIGSLGKYQNEDHVEHVIVKNCTMSNTDNGVRIKTWPGAPGTATVTDLHFEDITMVNVLNPIIIDQEYCPWNQCSKQIPSKVKISQVVFKNIKGTSKSKEGVTIICSKGVPCQGVELSNVALTFQGAPTTAKCANVNPKITGKAPACAA